MCKWAELFSGPLGVARCPYFILHQFCFLYLNWSAIHIYLWHIISHLIKHTIPHTTSSDKERNRHAFSHTRLLDISSWTNTFYSLHTTSMKWHKTVFHQIDVDDTQIYKFCRPSEIVDTINSIEQCISNVKTWMFHNKLQMNDNKEQRRISLIRKYLTAYATLVCSLVLSRLDY
jgi:hypothetical protein